MALPERQIGNTGFGVVFGTSVDNQDGGPTTYINQLLEYVDDYTGEKHSVGVAVSDYPVESGARITDHMITEPVVVTLTGFVSDALRASHTKPVPRGRDGGDDLTLRGREAWERILALLDNSLPIGDPITPLVTVYSRESVYTDMALINATADVSADTGDSLTFTLRFKQVRRADVRTEATTNSVVVRAKSSFIGTREDQFGMGEDPSDFGSMIGVKGEPIRGTATRMGPANINVEEESMKFRDTLVGQFGYEEGEHYERGGALPLANSPTMIFDEAVLPDLPRMKIGVTNSFTGSYRVTLGGQLCVLDVLRVGAQWQFAMRYPLPPGVAERARDIALGVAGVFLPIVGIARTAAEFAIDRFSGEDDELPEGKLAQAPIAPFQVLTRPVADQFMGFIIALPKPGVDKFADMGPQAWTVSHDLWYYFPQSADVIRRAVEGQ